MTTKSKVLLGLLVAVGASSWYALLGPKDESRVAVECAAADSGYSCTVRHEEGSRAAHACWDVVVACANGVKATARGCQDVSPGGTSTLLLPVASFQHGTECDSATGASIGRITAVPK